MIDLKPSQIAEFHRNIVRQDIKFENWMYKRMRPILNRQWLDAAKQLETTNSQSSIEQSINNQTERTRSLLEKFYIKVGKFYFDFTIEETLDIRHFTDYGIKDDESYWLRGFLAWVYFQARIRGKQISASTKSIIKKIVKKGLAEGKTYKEIATMLRKAGLISNTARAKRIARTEVHSANQKSIQETMRGLKLVKEKEWRTFIDGREREEHRAADGERVDKNEYYVRTGEAMMFPGDPNGSAWNTVNCRCVSLFYTRRR